jgi:hypothetical protein
VWGRSTAGPTDHRLTQTGPTTGRPEARIAAVALVDGRYAGTLRFRDRPRAGGRPFIDHLGARPGLDRALLVSGDREAEARVPTRNGPSPVHPWKGCTGRSRLAPGRAVRPCVAGSPWAVARPGLPQIRTCRFPASGSSDQRFTRAGTPSGRPVPPAADTAPAVPTGSPSRSSPSSYAEKATSARPAPRWLSYGSARSSSPSPRSRHRGRVASGSASRAAPGSVGAGCADTIPLSLSRTGGLGWLPSVS